MKRIAALMALMILANCGVDGEPLTPQSNATVSVGTNGVSVGGSTSIRKGNVTLGVGF